MSSPSSPSVAEILRSHVTLEVEGIDRMYLNVYMPRLQSPEGVAWYLREQRGAVCASSVLLQPISAAFVQKMEAFTEAHQIPVITFRIDRTLTRDNLAALRFGDPRVQALFTALITFRLLPNGFSNADLRAQLMRLSGADGTPVTAGRMTYDLRRLRLHGLITRVPKTHRYHLTTFGLRIVLFCTRSYARLIRPGLALVTPDAALGALPLRQAFQQLERAMHTWCEEHRVAA